MKKYRFPTSILWKDDGWREIVGETPSDATQKLREMGYLGIGLPNLQVWTGSDWQWAEELPPHLGGYNRRDERI